MLARQSMHTGRIQIITNRYGKNKFLKNYFDVENITPKLRGL